VRPRNRQFQRQAAHAVDFSTGLTAAITIPAQRIGISTAKPFSVMMWCWPTVQFPNGDFVWMLANSGTNTPDLNMSFASFGLFGGSENATTNVNPVINPGGWNLYAFTWTPAGVVNMWTISRSGKNFGTTTGATTSLTVGATTNFYVGNRGTVDAGYPCRIGGVSIYGRALSQQEVFAHSRQRGPVNNDQLLSYLPFKDLGTAGFDEVLNQAWPVSGTLTNVSAVGIGQPETNPSSLFVPTGGAAQPNDVVFYGINA
jgi:hypothetical protein